MSTAHIWPKPQWKEGRVRYAVNQDDYNIHAQSGVDSTGAVPRDGFGWSNAYKAPQDPFPVGTRKALHGPDGQSLSVASQAEMDAALKNGWSLKPVGTEAPAMKTEVLPTAYAPPRGLPTEAPTVPAAAPKGEKKGN